MHKFFFFFQAEDGIRDYKVTGVQTCALPIFGTYAIFMPMHYLGMAGMPRRYSQMTEVAYLHDLIPLQKFITYAAIITIRSEERRVGKECRSRGSPDH